MKIAGPSIMTELNAALAEVKLRILSNEINDTKIVKSAIKSWMVARRLAATKASTKTPITAPPSTIIIGARNEYCRIRESVMATSLPLAELDR